MGIYDREYYRDDRSSFLGTLVRRGQVWKWLVIANVATFVIQLATRATNGPDMNGWFTEAFDLQTDKVLRGQVWRLITAGFLHSFAWQHIVFNMLFLWWAGSEVEEIYGPREFATYYFSALLLSSSAYVIHQLIAHPGGPYSPAYGASGAVTAALMLFALHYPTRTIYIFFFFPVPIILFVLLNVLQDTLGLLGGGGQSVGFAAHLGGAAFGAAYYKFQPRLSAWLPDFSSLRLPRARPKLRVYTGDRESAAPTRPVQTPRAESSEHLEAELDAVLEKVARLGRAALTEREQNVLLKASEVYRQRRK